MSHRSPIFSSLSAAAALFLVAGAVFAHGEITFQDIAGDEAGLAYSREPSERFATLLEYLEDDVVDVPTEYFPAPTKTGGSPGLAILDYDLDGDLDVYVTNGPGVANSLFQNQLRETGHLAFVDVAAAAGVALTEEDSQGVCYGDIDNDRDPDLLVLGFLGATHLFENEGNGTFADITAASHIDGSSFTSTSCAFGDVDNDGLLDVAIANAFDFTTQLAFTIEPIVHNEPNQLFLNQGGNVFADVSVASGIRTKTLTPEIPNDVTWGVSLVDYDQDGDVDLFFADEFRSNGFDKAFLRAYRNDGTGHFAEVTAALDLDQVGSWRGLAFGDLNCDGRIDLFATNFGDYILFPGQVPPGTFSSAWFLQERDGTFANPGPGALITVPTGWGTSMIDYDNDADLDVVFYGGQLSPLFWDASNPGVVLNNTGGCSGAFTWDDDALGSPTAHVRRLETPLATGDLNDDGFEDVVTVSGSDVPEASILAPLFSNPLNSVFDVAALAVYVTVPTEDPDKFAFMGDISDNGSLAVEINSASNGHQWVKVELLGSAGITTNGQSNRDGIGAVVSFLPAPGLPKTRVTKPVLGGSSHASQHSLEQVFGLGHGRRGYAEVLWPGGTRNRLYGLRFGERATLPEIPCGFDDDWANAGEYVGCVVDALDELRDAGIVDNAGHLRFFLSALHAYLDEIGVPF